jgi:hypothetical protein
VTAVEERSYRSPIRRRDVELSDEMIDELRRLLFGKHDADASATAHKPGARFAKFSTREREDARKS